MCENVLSAAQQFSDKCLLLHRLSMAVDHGKASRRCWAPTSPTCHTMLPRTSRAWYETHRSVPLLAGLRTVDTP